MALQNDIVVYDASGQLALAVEVKNRRGTNVEWAAQMRQNLLTHSLVHAPYFLLALPDHFYLWVNKEQSTAVNPDYAIDPLPFLKPYLGASVVPEYLSE